MRRERGRVTEELRRKAQSAGQISTRGEREDLEARRRSQVWRATLSLIYCNNYSNVLASQYLLTLAFLQSLFILGLLYSYHFFDAE